MQILVGKIRNSRKNIIEKTEKTKRQEKQRSKIDSLRDRAGKEI